MVYYALTSKTRANDYYNIHLLVTFLCIYLLQDDIS